MGIIVWLIVGGICGWLASLIMRTDAQQGIILNIVVVIIGAVIAGLLSRNWNKRTGLHLGDGEPMAGEAPAQRVPFIAT